MQVQFSLLDRRPNGPNGMLQLCKERGIRLLCYGVVAGGLLTDRYLEKGSSPLHSRPHPTFLTLSCKATCALEMISGEAGLDRHSNVTSPMLCAP